MPQFSKINLLDIEVSDKNNDGVQARFSRKFLGSRDLGVSLFRYVPYYRAKTAHSHKVQEEAYVVVKGSGKILLNGEVVEIKEWDVIRVAPEVVRAFEAGADGLDIIAVGGPKPIEGDGVREDADWPS